MVWNWFPRWVSYIFMYGMHVCVCCNQAGGGVIAGSVQKAASFHAHPRLLRKKREGVFSLHTFPFFTRRKETPVLSCGKALKSYTSLFNLPK